MNTLANASRAFRSERPIRDATPDEDQGLSAVGRRQAANCASASLALRVQQSVKVGLAGAKRPQAKSGPSILTPKPSFRQQKRVGCYELTPEFRD